MYTLHCFLKLTKIEQRHDYTGTTHIFGIKWNNRCCKSFLFSKYNSIKNTLSCICSLGNVAEQQRASLLFSCLIDEGSKREKKAASLVFLIHRKINFENLQQWEKKKASRITGRRTEKTDLICEIIPARLDLHPACDVFDFSFTSCQR